MALTKSAKVVGLFVAATVAISGCSSDDGGDCYDRDKDGYCDDGGSSSRGGSSTYYGGGSSKSKSQGVSSGISPSSYKGGIGSSGVSSSG
ncbi:hypothetical protein [Brevibacillus sp. SAFN-007a]|uniref:hypothetical protein n=1 Tax=Brevibacillus sp. SAFN-007a TaxID=3436862 RepID=UPI003F7F9051